MEKKNNIDSQYIKLLEDILENGIKKQTRNGETISVFGRQIRHDMKDGFPLLTTKKMPFKTIVTELLWFLRGDTNIKYLVDNNCHIWDGDAYKNYINTAPPTLDGKYLSQPEFIHWIKTDDEFAKKWGELGPIYGKQWRDIPVIKDGDVEGHKILSSIDQIQNLINDLKTNPDSRRLMVNAWNVGELDQMVLPPCHYGFQVYTRELTKQERWMAYCNKCNELKTESIIGSTDDKVMESYYQEYNIPTRAISLMWNQRSVDTFLGLPFNIASYGLLLEIIAEIVNMVPDQLIGNLGDTHLYSNHIEQAKEQIGRELNEDERYELVTQQMSKLRAIRDEDYINYNIPTRTRQPYSLPKVRINTEFWNPGTEDGCGMGPGTYTKDIGALVEGMEVNDFQIEDYQSHPTIKAPLSN